MEYSKTNTREIVIEAATQVFIKKGYGSARMQEIADHAGINKGLLHYYFKSKKNLFLAVINTVKDRIAPKVDDLINSDQSLAEKIPQFVDFYMDILIENSFLPLFILSELNLHGEQLIKDIFHKVDVNPMKLLMQIQLEIQEKKIRPIEPFNLILNIISLCVFPFIARPIFKEVTGLKEEDYLKMMHLRKQEVTDFILNALLIK